MLTPRHVTSVVTPHMSNHTTPHHTTPHHHNMPARRDRTIVFLGVTHTRSLLPWVNSNLLQSCSQAGPIILSTPFAALQAYESAVTTCPSGPALRRSASSPPPSWPPSWGPGVLRFTQALQTRLQPTHQDAGVAFGGSHLGDSTRLPGLPGRCKGWSLCRRYIEGSPACTHR